MKSSISSFTYKGSIAEAILESKKQKKLFVVYISGENVASAELGKSTWTDSKVAESLSKYCILLHIPEGSTDALNFSAIYQQKSAPCITAIGYNGVQLWQSEGFVTAEVLASGLEEAWLTLHIQETTATVLTTALALKKPEPLSGSSDIGSSGQGSSSGTVVPVPLKDRHIQPSEVGTQAAASEVIEENKSNEPTAEKTITNLGDKTSSKSFNVQKSQTVGDERSTCPTEEDKKSPSSSVTSTDNIIADHTSSAAEDGLLAQEKSISNHTGVPTGGSELSTTEIKEVEGDKKAESMDDVVPGTLNNNKKVNVSSDVHLNIRLPDGVSLQEKFSVTSTLRMVKDYVDRNQASGIGAYDLAIPYPRKTFSDQDLNKSLSELSLLNRQALIVVPRQRASSYHQRGSLSDRATTTTSSGSVNANDGGYFAYVKRILSYANPLSYFGGSVNPSSSGQAQSAIGEYGPDSTSQNNTPRVDRPYSSYSPNQNSPSTGRNDSKGKQPTTSRVGSNIHTLKHDEANTSGQFVGLAEMVGPVDFNKTVEYWQQDKWTGCFPLKWHIIKDVPNGCLRHITLENNENKPVTNSRDTQEVIFEKGVQILKIFKDHKGKTSILDDFSFYAGRERIMQEKRAKHNIHKQISEGKSAVIGKESLQTDAASIKEPAGATPLESVKMNGEVNGKEENGSDLTVENSGRDATSAVSSENVAPNVVASAC